MNCYNIDDMRKELWTIGDYSKSEVEKMNVGQVISAWTSLPAIELNI